MKNETGVRDSVWCEACRSYHVIPASKEEHAALRCFAPFDEQGSLLTGKGVPYPD